MKTFGQICKEELEKIIEGKSTLSTNNKTFYSCCAEIYTLQEVKKHLSIAAEKATLSINGNEGKQLTYITDDGEHFEVYKESITSIKIELT